MSNTDDVYLTVFVVNLVENPPVAYTYPPQIVPACKLQATWGTRIFQQSEGLNNSRAHRVIERSYFSLCRLSEGNAIGGFTHLTARLCEAFPQSLQASPEAHRRALWRS